MQAGVGSYGRLDGIVENRRASNHLVRCQAFDIEAKYGHSARHCLRMLVGYWAPDGLRILSEMLERGRPTPCQSQIAWLVPATPPKNWPAGLNSAVDDRHLDSTIPRRSRPY